MTKQYAYCDACLAKHIHTHTLTEKVLQWIRLIFSSNYICGNTWINGDFPSFYILFSFLHYSNMLCMCITYITYTHIYKHITFNIIKRTTWPFHYKKKQKRKLSFSKIGMIFWVSWFGFLKTLLLTLFNCSLLNL